jgi:dipeptidyl-peptidase-4
MIIPPNFDEEKKHPVLMYVYGGPGSQEVINQWRGNEYWWFQMLAQKGYIIACIDNRGTGGRGTAFKNITQGNLGYYELQDQLSAAKYLGSLNFIDSGRIGIYGWSYGGYLALKCLIEGSNTFSMGISIAPVVDWKWFNAIYSERHMGLPKDNSQGYFNSNLLSRIHLLEDPFLLIHGMADDIVHFQHAAELTKSLISYNKEYEAYLYPNRNHGIYGDNARLHMYSRMTNFIINNL